MADSRERGLRRAGGKRLSQAGSSRLLEQLQAELMEELQTHQDAAVLPERAAVAPGGWLAAAFITWLVVALLLLASPEVARGPVSHPFLETPARREASLRYGVYLADLAVQRFLGAHGRLPSFPAEAGISDSSIQMQVTGERSYVLDGVEGEARVMLASDASARDFLGTSYEQLTGN